MNANNRYQYHVQSNNRYEFPMTDNDAPSEIDGSNDYMEMESWTLQTNGLVVHYDGKELRYADISKRLDEDWSIAEEGLVAMKTEDAMDLTPNEELRGLVDEWRGRESHSKATEMEQIIWGTAINDLEAVIENND